ncbi:TetR/AcrR family transcriptional regulator [Nocardia asteroides]|uniref:TetR/AcrR family transcriptional regulator n=1 Tax=Nocardia asteroides TaxID=1824 RepID=UPI0037CC4E62
MAVSKARSAAAGAVSGARAQANRRRILDVATAELTRNPAVSMEDIAVAAGVVRRTVYAHFPAREALIDGILDRTFEDLERAFRVPPKDEPVALTMARFMIALWRVGDEYRLLFKLTETNLRSRIEDRLAPVHFHGTELLREGQRLGVFSDHLPANVLSHVLSGMMLALLEARNDEAWTAADTAASAAEACLIAIGVPRAAAEDLAAAAVELEKAG